jgi:hypothetical protein
MDVYGQLAAHCKTAGRFRPSPFATEESRLERHGPHRGNALR